MKVRFEKRKVYKFSDIKLGECFFAGDILYMKVNTSDKHMSLNVQTGQAIFLADTEEVEPIESEIIVWRE